MQNKKNNQKRGPETTDHFALSLNYLSLSLSLSLFYLKLIAAKKLVVVFKTLGNKRKRGPPN